jgi:hypothetical protein
VNGADVGSQGGLTSEEAHRRLEKFGLNTMPDTALHPWRMALEKFQSRTTAAVVVAPEFLARRVVCR